MTELMMPIFRACLSACVMPLDLAIVVDKSDYWLSTREFSQLREGISTLVSRVFVAADLTHVTVVSYAANATLHFNLVQYFRPGPMQSTIRGIQQDDSGTMTDLVSYSLLVNIHSRQQIFAISVRQRYAIAYY